MKPTFQPERRICFVRYLKSGIKWHPAFFHTFTTIAEPVEPKHGKPGGQVSKPVAIVEFKDGTIEFVSPDRIRFLDTEQLMKQYSWGEKEEPQNATIR